MSLGKTWELVGMIISVSFRVHTNSVVAGDVSFGLFPGG